jgi:hypothetical protein
MGAEMLPLEAGYLSDSAGGPCQTAAPFDRRVKKCRNVS